MTYFGRPVSKVVAQKVDLSVSPWEICWQLLMEVPRFACRRVKQVSRDSSLNPGVDLPPDPADARLKLINDSRRTAAPHGDLRETQWPGTTDAAQP